MCATCSPRRNGPGGTWPSPPRPPSPTACGISLRHRCVSEAHSVMQRNPHSPTSAVALAVIAKAPVPGRVKPRLCPPSTGTEAAELAAASLHDTLAAVAATPAPRRVLVLDGDPGDWVPSGFAVIAQRGA